MASKLRGRDLQVFGMHLQGMKGTEIAAILKVTPQTIYNITNSPDFKEALQLAISGTIQEITENIGGRFSPLTIAKANAAKAMEMTVALMVSGRKEEIRLRAAQDICDRVMGKPTQRIAIEDLEDSIIERMSEQETELYITQGIVPDWARDAGLAGKPPTLQ